MYFYTATINSWQSLLKDDEFKDIVVGSLKWLDNANKAFTHGFVIMPNHIHVLWSYGDDVRYDPAFALVSFTAHEFKKKLKEKSPHIMEHYISTQADRAYHFWERRSRTIEVKSREIAIQKLDYIHNNPLQDKWQLASIPEDYRYSSAEYYLYNKSEFDFLRHYQDFI